MYLDEDLLEEYIVNKTTIKPSKVRVVRDKSGDKKGIAYVDVKDQ